jgi:hypothetical protein
MMTGEEVWSYVQPVLIDAIRDKRLPGAAYMTVNKALMAMDKNGQEQGRKGLNQQTGGDKKV